MQSNGSAIHASDSQQVGNIASPTKKIPPKPPKRVSFDLKYRQIGEKPSPIESPNPFREFNGALDENSNDRKLETGVNLRKNSVDTKSEIDKTDKAVIPAKVNTDICDTGQLKTDNKIHNKSSDNVEKNEPVKQTKNEQLRSEFVKTNDSPEKASSWRSRNSEARSSVDSNSSLKSPLSPDLQNRLTESQSKIAKLQQSLPKLSDATVDALKYKYSPASFGYPKIYNKSSIETSKIPVVLPRSIGVKDKEETNLKVEKESDIQSSITVPATQSIKNEDKTKEIAPKVVKQSNIESNITALPTQSIKDQEETKETVSKVEKDSNIVNSTITSPTLSTTSVKRKPTFRTELYILPVNSSSTKPPEYNSTSKSIVDKSVNIEIANTKDDLEVPTVQVKLISSEIFPKEADPVEPKPEQTVVKEECVPAQQKTTAESVFIEDNSEQSSDTLTESEDSQNIKFRKTVNNSDLDITPSKLQDIENNNSTDPDTSSFTSDITYCEVYEDEFEAALPSEKESDMEDPKKKPQKKRSNSFKRIFGFGSKEKKKDDKKKEEEKKSNVNGKKRDNMSTENAQNEAHVFDRNVSQRHTIGGHYNSRNWDRKVNEPYYSNERYQVPRQQEQNSNSNYDSPSGRGLQRQNSLQGHRGHKLEDRLNKIQYDLLLAQQTNHQLNSNIPVNSPLHRNLDEYVCMDSTDKSKSDLTQPGFINAHSIDKYIDTTTSSSSISTLESDTRNVIYENTVKTNKGAKVSNNLNTKIPVSSSSTLEKNDSPPSIGEKFYERPKFADSPEMFTTTPKRAQGPQLIKPKAIIPINTERALPNPYRSIRESKPKSPEIRENLYGNLPNLNNSSNEKEIVKPIPPVRRNIPVSDSAYGNLSNNETDVNTEEIYGTVYDSLVPVGAQLRISKPPIINSEQNEKRSRSVSPSQRLKTTNLTTSQSFNRKSRLPVQSPPTSPNRKELEATKLRLPSNRTKLEPQLKSPTEERKNTKRNPEIVKKDNENNIPSHQNLELEIDYPDNNLNEIQDRKETPEKSMFSSDNEPSSPKRGSSIKRQPHVSPNRPKSFTHSTPKSQTGDEIRSSAFRSASPASINSSHSLNSLTPKSKPMTSADKKDLKNTEVYYYEQTANQNVKKDDNSPDQSPQQVLTQATVHQPKSSPRPTESPIARRTPVDQQLLNKTPTSPQKVQNLQNVEAFYWHQIKKEHELYNQHLQMLARQNSMQVPPEYMQNRSRSLSAGARQGQRRSSSLPRDVAPPNFNQKTSNDLYGYTRSGRQITIPEGRPVEMKTNQNRGTVPDYGMIRQHFVRGSPQRSTVGPISTQKHSQQEFIYENYYPGVELRHQAKSMQGSGYAPIFKRGSLVPTSSQESSPQVNKKVSFSSAQSEEVQIWPTKNGFTQSPPTRRVDRKSDSIDDDVFLPDNMKQQQMIVNLSQEPQYVSKLPPAHPKDTIYVSNMGQTEPVYGRTSTGKQVTIKNKVCDMYGQIHDAAPSIYGNIKKTGVIYGQLQPNPVPGSPASLRNQYLNRSDPTFVRGSRLTASFNDMQTDAPRRPLPPIPGSNAPFQKIYGRVNVPVSESESGSEAGEVQRILAQKERRRIAEEEWNSDSKSGRSQSGGESGRGGEADGEVRGGRGSRSGRRDDPRRHTLASGADYHPGMAVQGGPLSRTMDLEMPMPRGYPPPSTAMLFDDDPGIMSEVETSSTGFRRGGKQRSSLPVVRTPSKTLERPLGLVFLQYRNETKRALLPNEITSIDTVKALFVRSFPKQLTMEYLDSPLVKIYIHDSSKDMFYELEDLRSHLRDIRDRSVLRLFESADISGGLPGPGTGISGGVGHFEDQSYFSEPEFDSEYQHQHIHKSKTSGAKGAPPYYMGSTTLPRGGPLLRAYSPAIGGPIPADRLKSLPTDRIHTDGYMSSPERGSRASYEDPYYSQYASRSGSITPVIDEEARLRVENMERQLANLTGLVQKALHQTPAAAREFLQVPGGRDNYRTDKSVSFEKSVSFSDEPPDMNSPKQHSPQHTERDRLKPAPPPKPASLSPAQYDNSRHIYRDLQLTPEMYNQLRGLQKKAKDLRTEVRNLRRLSQAQAHSVRETIKDTFIKIRAMLLASGEQVWQAGIDQEKLRLSREEDLYKQEMIRLEKDLTELESTVEELRGNVINRKTRVNMSDVENMALILSKSSKTVADLKLRFPGLQDGMKNLLSSEMEKVVREEKFLKEEPERLENALRRCKKLTGTLVTLKRLASVQEQRLPCSNSTDGQLSPTLTETPPITPQSAQHSKPPAMSAARTVLGQSLLGGESGSSGSCDSSQRPENALDALLDELQTFSKPHSTSSSSTPAPSTVTTQLPQAASYKVPGSGSGTPSMAEIGRKGSMDSATLLPVQNLTVSTATGSLRRLHSYPSGSDTDNSPPIQPLQRSTASANKPPIPERNAELLQHLASGRRVPPPPPPRTSSKSPLASPTSPSLPPRSAPGQNALQHIQNVQNMTEKPQSQFEAATQNLGLGTLRRNVPGRSSLKEKSQTLPRNIGSNLQVQTSIDGPPENKPNPMSTSNSSSCESVNSQEGAKKGSRKEELEQRHQELLKKQKALQEQYARLQQLQRGNNTLTVVPPAPDLLLKKTGSESNLLQKMGLQMAAPQQMTGSLTHLANASLSTVPVQLTSGTTTAAGDKTTTVIATSNANTTTSKVYETDIL